MNDLFGLIFVALVLAGMGLFCAVKLRRYNPDGDKCEHGVRMPEGYCGECGGSAAPLTDSEVDAWLAAHANDPVDGEQVERVRRRVEERLAGDA